MAAATTDDLEHGMGGFAKRRTVGGLLAVLVGSLVGTGVPLIAHPDTAIAVEGPVVIGLQPPNGAAGTTFAVQGCGFTPGASVEFRFDDVDLLGTATTGSNGCITSPVLTVPADAVDGPHPMVARDAQGRETDEEFRVEIDPYVVARSPLAVAGEAVAVEGCNWVSSTVNVSLDGLGDVSASTVEGCFTAALPVDAGAPAGDATLTAEGGGENDSTTVAVVAPSAVEQAVAGLAAASAGVVDIDVTNPTGPWAFVEIPRTESDAATAAMDFLTDHRVALGMSDPQRELYLRRSSTRTLRTLRFGQQFGGIEVCAGEVWVGLSGSAIYGVHGRWLHGPPTASSIPVVPANRAVAIATEAVGGTQLGSPTPCWFSDELARTGVGSDGPSLAWRVQMVPDLGASADVVYVDAQTGSVRLVLPGSLSAWYMVDGTRSRSSLCGYGESGLKVSSFSPDSAYGLANRAMSDVETDYFWAYFRRVTDEPKYTRSLVLADAKIPTASPNAFYDGCLRFSPGWAQPDIIAHEYGHGVTGSGSGLVYSGESGALNEHFSDAVALFVGCHDLTRCDRDDYRIGEGIPGGQLRDMLDPAAAFQPDVYRGARWAATTSTAPDNGGVHTNSGVPNLVTALLLRGGVHNGLAIEPIPLETLDSLWVWFQTELLTPNSSMSQLATLSRVMAHTFAVGGYANLGSYVYGGWAKVVPHYLGWTLDQACQVRNAWASVGLGAPDADCDDVLDPVEGGDKDGDGWSDDIDSCPLVANPYDQLRDLDADGQADPCDADADGDGVLDTIDTCPGIPNNDQVTDTNTNGIPDDCEDTDVDGVSNLDDNCPGTANHDQADVDGDGAGDACDGDSDGDGISNGSDNCPLVANGAQDDSDKDGTGDACDNCPSIPNPGQENSDGAHDGGDACDTDDDDDGILDINDNCPTTANQDQADLDGDGAGYVCDPQERETLNGDLLQLTVPADGVSIPIGGCPSCGLQTLYSDLWSRTLDVTSETPVDAFVLDPSGTLITSATGDSISLSFHPESTSLATGTAGSTAAATRVEAVATAPSGSGQYLLQVVPHDSNGSVDVRVAAQNDPASPAIVERLAGADRYATAVEAAGFVGNSGTVYVATGQNFPDALAGGPAAVHDGGPVLLTHSATLDAVVADELDERRPTEIVVLGGPAAVSDAVIKDLEAWAPVRRMAGQDRYETAAAIAAATFDHADRVYVATGQNYPDALAGGAVAARDSSPVLLVTHDSVPAATATQLARLRPNEVVVLGGTAAITDAVVSHIAELTGGTTTRIAGADRYETSAAIAASFDAGVSTVLVATGTNFPDAIAAVPAARAARAPILLVHDDLPSTVADRLQALQPHRLTVLGGTVAVPESLDDTLRALVRP